jgi:hypothetical protein
VNPGACSGVVTVQQRDSLGNPSPSVASWGLTAAPAAGFTFYSNAGCTTTAANVAFNGGVTQMNYYFKSSTLGPVTISTGTYAQTEFVGQPTVFKVGSFTKPMAPGAQTVPHGLGTIPKAILFWTVGKPNQVASSDYRLMLGVTDGTTSRSISVASQDNPPNSVSGRRMAAVPISMVDYTQSTYAEAALTSLDATNIVLNWTANSSTADVIHYLAIGGSTVTAKVVQWTAPTAPGNRAVTGLGFQPSAVLNFHTGYTVTAPPPFAKVSATCGMGFMDSVGSQWTWGVIAIDSASPTQAGRVQVTDSCLYAWDQPNSITKRASYASMDASGFTTNFSVANSSASQIFSLALGGLSVRGGSFNKSAGATQAITGLGFKPGAVFFSSAQDVAQTGGTSESRHGLGASDGVTQTSCALNDSNNVSRSVANAIDKTGKVFMKMDNGTKTIEAEASLASFDSDGMTLNWTTNDAVPTQITWFALGP